MRFAPESRHSQSVKTTEAGGPRGFDAAKKIKGRKRHVAVDTLGLPIECQITPANMQDRDALASVLRETHRKSPFVTMCFVDLGYRGGEAQRAAFEASRISITVVQRNDRQIKGFVILPKRWVVERTFGWINRARRLAKDFEATIKFRARMAAYRSGIPAHATPRKALKSGNVIFEFGLLVVLEKDLDPSVFGPAAGGRVRRGGSRRGEPLGDRLRGREITAREEPTSDRFGSVL